jgi:AcrR family transcriptional regulator
VGFRALGIDAIAAKAGVGKATIYRRWPNKAAVVMDAFLAEVGPGTGFPPAPRAMDRIRMQMEAQSRAFRSKYGVLIKSLLGEAQFDLELAEAFRERWIMPRRRLARKVLEEAIEQGDLRDDIDIEAAIDMLYAPIYYRLQIQTGPITEKFVDGVFGQVMAGLRSNGKGSTARSKRQF